MLPAYQNPIDAVVDNFSYDNLFFIDHELKGFQQAVLHLPKGLVLEHSHQNTVERKNGLERKGREGRVKRGGMEGMGLREGRERR